MLDYSTSFDGNLVAFLVGCGVWCGPRNSDLILVAIQIMICIWIMIWIQEFLKDSLFTIVIPVDT